VNLKKLGAGLLLFFFGLLFFISGLDYNVGTIANMGPGFYPKYLSIILMIFGIISVIRARQ
jgi:hypothetical protein